MKEDFESYQAILQFIPWSVPEVRERMGSWLKRTVSSGQYLEHLKGCPMFPGEVHLCRCVPAPTMKCFDSGALIRQPCAPRVAWRREAALFLCAPWAEVMCLGSNFISQPYNIDGPSAIRRPGHTPWKVPLADRCWMIDEWEIKYWCSEQHVRPPPTQQGLRLVLWKAKLQRMGNFASV